MKYITLKPFAEQYASFPDGLKRKVDKQIRNLLSNLRHPSLRAKKYDETKNIWQARIDDHYRFYFKIDGDAYILLKIKKHTD